VEFWAYGPSGKIQRIIGWGSESRTGTTSSGHSSATVDSLTWPAGDYKVEFIAYSDVAGNGTDTRYVTHGLDLGQLSFKVLDAASQVTPASITFTDEDGTAHDTYTVPATTGVQYLVGGKVVAAGTYPGAATVSVTAEAQTDYVLAPGAISEWSATFKTTPYLVSPAEAKFTDNDGTAQDTYTIPTTPGVQYLVGDNAMAAGTYPGTGTVTVTARAQTDYSLTPGAPASWTATFKGSLVGPAPRITGSATVGSTLTANPGTWAPPPVSLRYQWYRSGVAIIGATAATLRLTAADVGATFVVRVIGMKPGYANVGRSSAASAVVAKYSVVPATPTVSGSVMVGRTLTATPGTWAPSPVTFRYQWYRSGVAIIGATTPTRMLTAADAGATITVQVVGSRTGYTTGSRTSAATLPVAKNSLVGAVPAIGGTAKVGYTLKANPGIWSPAPVTLRYQWYRSGAAIIGATAATYKPTAADAGATLTGRTIGSKPGYTTAGKTSAPTAAVAKGSLAGGVPSINAGVWWWSDLTADPGTWSPSPVTLRYQWYRSGVAIIGATAPSYSPASGDVWEALTVRVIASKTGYTTVGKSSGAFRIW
jgi:hypothetical protein